MNHHHTYLKELDAPRTQHVHCVDNVKSSKSDVLHTGAVVVIHKLLDLTFAKPVSGFVNGHFDCFIRVCCSAIQCVGVR